MNKKLETKGKPMTIAELYKWAKENGYENHTMIVGPLADGYMWNICTAEVTAKKGVLTAGYGPGEETKEVIHIKEMDW